MRFQQYVVISINILLVACYSSNNSGYDSNNDSSDDSSEDIFMDEDWEDSSEIDPPQDVAEEADNEEELVECIFNENPIGISIEGKDCELIEELNEGEWYLLEVEGQIKEIIEEELVIENPEDGETTVHYNGLEKSDFKHNILLDDWIKIEIIILNQSGQCIKGISLKIECGFSQNIVMIYRFGDMNNPLYPFEENFPFHTELMPFQIDRRKNDCTISSDGPSECTYNEVFDMTFTNESDEDTLLYQGQDSYLSNGSESREIIYRVMNNYSYRSEDCGGEQLSYFIQLIDPPRICAF